MKLKLKASIRTAAEEWREKYDYDDYAGGFDEDFHKGFPRVKLNGKWGFVDATGKEVVPLKYDYAGFFQEQEGLAPVYLNNKRGFVDVTGKEVVPLKYDRCSQSSFDKGLAEVRLYGVKWGFVDVTGKEYWNMTKEEARKQMKS